MSTAELTIRLAAMVLGFALIVTGLVIGWRQEEEGCLPFVAALLGFLMIASGFPSDGIFP